MTPRRDADSSGPVWVGICAKDDKRCFISKHAAKLATKQFRSNGRMTAYRCGNWWHMGHLPKQITNGDATRDDLGRK